MSTTPAADNTAAQGEDAMRESHERRDLDDAMRLKAVMTQLINSQAHAIRDHLQALGSHLIQGTENMYALSDDDALCTGPHLCDSNDIPVFCNEDGTLAFDYKLPLWWKEDGAYREVDPTLITAFSYASKGLAPLLQDTALDYKERRKTELTVEWGNGRAYEEDAQRTHNDNYKMLMEGKLYAAKVELDKEVQLRSAAQRETSNLRERQSEMELDLDKKQQLIDGLKRHCEKATQKRDAAERKAADTNKKYEDMQREAAGAADAIHKCEDAQREAADAIQKRDEMADELRLLKEEIARAQEERVQHDIEQQQQQEKFMGDIGDEIGKIFSLYIESRDYSAAAYTAAQQHGSNLFDEAQQRYEALVAKLNPKA